MTPAEARQIDNEEFAAECAAALERALAYSKRCREQERQRVVACIRDGREPARPKFNRPCAATGVGYTAFGITRSITEWAAETGVSTGTIYQRIRLGWTIERALTVPKHDAQLTVRNRRIIQRIVSTFRATRGYRRTSQKTTGTGGGRHARDLQSKKLRN